MDIETIVNQIKEDFSEEHVCELFDEEVPKWLDEGWETEFDTAFEAYAEQGHGEAQDETIAHLITHWQNKYQNGKELDDKTRLNVYYKLKDTYGILE